MLPDGLPGESGKAHSALIDYCQMGPGRSLSTLAERYRRVPKPVPPTVRLNTLKEWSVRFKWQERTAAYDAGVQAAAEADLRELRRAVLEEGLALDYERVQLLKDLAGLLRTEVFEEAKHWVTDVKVIGYGESAEQVDIVRFNAPLIEQLRGTLDDIAKEVGGRKTKIEATGANGGPLEFNAVIAMTAERELADWRQEMLSNWRQDQQRQIVAELAGLVPG